MSGVPTVMDISGTNHRWIHDDDNCLWKLYSQMGEVVAVVSEEQRGDGAAYGAAIVGDSGLLGTSDKPGDAMNLAVNELKARHENKLAADAASAERADKCEGVC